MRFNTKSTCQLICGDRDYIEKWPVGDPSHEVNITHYCLPTKQNIFCVWDTCGTIEYYDNEDEAEAAGRLIITQETKD